MHLNSMGYKRLKKMLVKEGQGAIYELMCKCLSLNPQERPQTYEAIFKVIAKSNLPEQSYAIWNNLRRKSQQNLKELGFRDPASGVIRKAA